jgi:hypothetical protein
VLIAPKVTFGECDAGSDLLVGEIGRSTPPTVPIPSQDLRSGSNVGNREQDANLLNMSPAQWQQVCGKISAAFHNNQQEFQDSGNFVEHHEHSP